MTWAYTCSLISLCTLPCFIISLCQGKPTQRQFCFMIVNNLNSGRIRVNSIFVSKQSSFTFNSFPNAQILDASILKEFADDNFKFDENGKKFSKWAENTVKKGETARYEQFLLLPPCFQKTCTADT